MGKWKTICTGVIIEFFVIGMAFAVKDVSLYWFLALMVFAVVFPLILKSEKLRGLADSSTLMTDTVFMAGIGGSFVLGYSIEPYWISVPALSLFIIDALSWRGRCGRKQLKVAFPKLSGVLICVQLPVLVLAVFTVTGFGVLVTVSAFVIASVSALLLYRRAVRLSAFVRRELRLVSVIDLFSVFYCVTGLFSGELTSQELAWHTLCLVYCAADLVRWKIEADLHFLDIFDD